MNGRPNGIGRSPWKKFMALHRLRLEKLSFFIAVNLCGSLRWLSESLQRSFSVLLPVLVCQCVCVCVLVLWWWWWCVHGCHCVFLCLLVCSCVFMGVIVCSYVSLCVLVCSCVFLGVLVCMCVVYFVLVLKMPGILEWLLSLGLIMMSSSTHNKDITYAFI